MRENAKKTAQVGRHRENNFRFAPCIAAKTRALSKRFNACLSMMTKKLGCERNKDYSTTKNNENIRVFAAIIRGISRHAA